MKDKKEVFKNGATWLRADFHLHTDADNEFKYPGDKNYYLSSYINALKEASISVGVITNHNKFDYTEFKDLRKTAINQGIFLLPGAEIFLNDGAGGIHVLVVFSEGWLENDNDRISTFIAAMFPGKATAEYQRENARSDKNVLQLIEELQRADRDYFLIFAHVEDSKGLWEEMKGGKIADLATLRYAEVRRHTLGFQKVRGYDKRKQVKQWLGDWYPAEVEGSDPKSIAEIGKGKEVSFIKLGAFTFEAVKFALTDYSSRLAAEPRKITHSYIQSIEFTGGVLDGKVISFSKELNTLIGIRGSGKSAVLEMIRYVLNIPIGANAGDPKYKSELVKYALKSGGKVTLIAVNRYGQTYRIERILNELPVVWFDGKTVPGVSIGETVIHKPLYFGQKDLSNSSEGFERDLVEKLVAAKLTDVRRRINEQNQGVRQSAAQLLNEAAVTTRIEELEKEKQDIAHRLTIFTRYGMEEKLQKRLDFDNDSRFMQSTVNKVRNTSQELLTVFNDHTLPELGAYQSKHNTEIIEKFVSEYENAKLGIEKLPEQLEYVKKALGAMEIIFQEFEQSKRDLAEEFAEIERNLAQEFVSGNVRLSPDDFLKLKRRQAQVEQELSMLIKSNERKDKAYQFLFSQLTELGELRHGEFLVIQKELAAIGAHSDALEISCEYKGDKAAFLNFAKDMFKGSGIREVSLQKIVDEYADFAALFKNYTGAKENGRLGNNSELFTDWFNRNLADFLTYQVPNRFEIRYRGKELHQHSLGQRASALILFVLSQKDNDLILIDQPEDDLDNQTIYEDVIKLICELKPSVQFILATHNPNIPVLGDAEQVLACSFSEDAVQIQSGGIDNPQQQQTIVNIMEGGKEAFNRRKEIYQSWNS